MRTSIRSLLLILAILLAPGLAPATAQGESGSDLLAAVNAFRAARGMPPFQANASLFAAAQGQAGWSAATGNRSHSGQGGSRPQDRATAAGYVGYAVENFACGTSGYVDIAWVIQMWSSDDVHLGTMLSTAPDAGAGVASSASDTWYVLVVGRPSAAAPRPPAAGSEAGAASPRPEGEGAGVRATAAIPAVPVVIAEPDASGTVIHVVQQGQTLWDLAVTYDVEIADLLAYNHLRENALLHPGDRIIVRLGPGQTPPPAPTVPAVHVVQAGETLWTLSRRYGLDLDDLRALNGLAEGALLLPGMELILHAPEPSATPTPTTPPTSTPQPLAPAATATLPPTASPLLVAVGEFALTATPAIPVSPTATLPPAPPIAIEGSADLLIFVGGLALALIVGGLGGAAAMAVMKRR